MSYTVHEAKTNLSRLIKEAESGKEVVITRGKKRIPGSMKGLLWSSPDAFDPLTDEEMRELGFE